MAKLICKDGTEIQISDETESSLRKAFGPKPSYKDFALKVYITENVAYPICIVSDVTRDIADTEKFIVALQAAVKYCKQHNLGV